MKSTYLSVCGRIILMDVLRADPLRGLDPGTHFIRFPKSSSKPYKKYIMFLDGKSWPCLVIILYMSWQMSCHDMYKFVALIGWLKWKLEQKEFWQDFSYELIINCFVVPELSLWKSLVGSPQFGTLTHVIITCQICILSSMFVWRFVNSVSSSSEPHHRKCTHYGNQSRGC